MSVSKKRAAPRPPVPGMQTAPGGTNKENEKISKKENGHGEDVNMNESVVLKVVLPDQTADEIEVSGLMPLMDLRMQLCAKYKLSPSSYKLEPIELDGRAIPYTSSSTVGSIDAKAVALKSKAKEPVKIVPPKVVEQTVRLTIKMSQSSKQVLRVRPSVPLDKLLPQILEKSGFKQEKYQFVELRHPDQPTMKLDTSRSLDDYKIREIFVADKRVPVPEPEPQKHEPESETMSIQSDDTSPDKTSNPEVKKSGSLKKSKKLKAFFRLSKKSKHSPMSSPPPSEQSSISPATSPPIPASRSPDNINQQPQVANINENNSKQREEEHKSKKKKAPVKQPEPQNEPLHGQVSEKIDEPPKAETVEKQKSVESDDHTEEEEEVKKIVPPRPHAPPRVKPRQQPVPATRLHATGKKKAPPPPGSPDSDGPSSPSRPSRPEKPPRKHSVEKSNKDRPIYDAEGSPVQAVEVETEVHETMADGKSEEPMETAEPEERKVDERPPTPDIEEPVPMQQGEEKHEEIVEPAKITTEQDKEESEISQSSEPEVSHVEEVEMNVVPPQVENVVVESEVKDPVKPLDVPEELVTESAIANEIQSEVPTKTQEEDARSVSISSAEDLDETPIKKDVELERREQDIPVPEPPTVQDEVILASEPEPEVKNQSEEVNENLNKLPPDLEDYAMDMKFDVSKEDDDVKESEPVGRVEEANESFEDLTPAFEKAAEVEEPTIPVEKVADESSDEEPEDFTEPKVLRVGNGIDSKTALADEDNLFTAPSHFDPNFGQTDAPEGEFDFMAAEAIARQMISNFGETQDQPTEDEGFPLPPPPEDMFDNQPSPPPPTPAFTQPTPAISQPTQKPAVTSVNQEEGETDEETKQKIEQLQQQINIMKRKQERKKAEEEAAKKNPYTIIEEKGANGGQMQKPGAKTYTFVPNKPTKKVYEDYETAAPAGINLLESGEIRGVGIVQPQAEEKPKSQPASAENVEQPVVKTIEKPVTPPQEPVAKPTEVKSPERIITSVPKPVTKPVQPVVIKEREPEPQKPKGVPASAPTLPKGLSSYVASAAMKRQNTQTTQSKQYVPSQAAQDEELSSTRKSSLPNYYKKFLGIKALQSAVENKEEDTKKSSIITSSVPEEKVVPNGELSPKPNPPKKPEALKSPPPVKAPQPKPQEVIVVEQSKKEETAPQVVETVKIQPVTHLPLPPEEKSPIKTNAPVTNIDDVPLPPPPEEFLTPAKEAPKTQPPTSLDYSRRSSASSTSSTKSPGYSPRSSNIVGISAAKPFSPGGASKPMFRPMSAAFKSGRTDKTTSP